ncbi:MAG: cytochrome c oxidase subunit 3, partial [Caulobacteraceae bacterium]|nr:cytochrome c oxidase subunit 3 [Caulobacter sp.]
QREATQFGMWVFLASEILLFGGLFAAYAVLRWTGVAGFVEGARHTDELLGALNTGWLLTSSAALSVAGRALDAGRTRLAVIGVWVTLLFGLLFLGTKGLEYVQDLHAHLWPGPDFALAAPAAQNFFALYWVTTGIHSIHLIIGMALVGRLALMARAGVLQRRTDSMEATTLYWHLVDAIWVVLFTCLYLVGR